MLIYIMHWSKWDINQCGHYLSIVGQLLYAWFEKSKNDWGYFAVVTTLATLEIKNVNYWWWCVMFFCHTTQWAGVRYHKRSWLSTALCSKSDGIIWVDRDSVQSIQYGKWIILAHRFAWFRLGQFYYYDSTQELKVSILD